MKFVSWIMKYNKAMVPLLMAGTYFLNAKYGVVIPLDEGDVVSILGIITGFLVWLVPNKSKT